MTAQDVVGRLSSSRKWMFRFALIGAAALWIMCLRPTSLGGPASYVVVAGDSMLPTYADGTLVVSLASPTYVVGDVITFAVDVDDVKGRPLVIHRIVGGDAEDGYNTQGDNRPFTDPWTVQVGDVVGREAWAIQGAGQALLLVRSPIVLASIGAAVAAYVIMGWTPGPRRPRREAAPVG
jgi:signal peptidase I